jgi:hypothetical protein
MAFVIKNMNMYFSGIADYTTLTGYLDKNHPIKLHQFKPTQNKTMIFKDYFSAQTFMTEHGIDGHIVKVNLIRKVVSK